jgi:hypothetical protein
VLPVAKTSSVVCCNELSWTDFFCRPWLLHFQPKFIELALYEIHEQITGRADFDMDFMDICIRRIKQMDDMLYASHSECRWRHFMEADFLVRLDIYC